MSRVQKRSCYVLKRTGNFIKIAYSGNSMNTHPNQSGFTTPLSLTTLHLSSEGFKTNLVYHIMHIMDITKRGDR